MTSLFALTATCFAGCVCVHWLFVRLLLRSDFVRNGYIFICVAGAGLLPLALRLGAVGFVFFYLTLAVLWNLYTIFFINLMNSVSLRMMVEIAASPELALSAEQLGAIYSDEHAFESRVRGLVATGFLQASGGELALTPKGRSLARALCVIRGIFGIKTYG